MTMSDDELHKCKSESTLQSNRIACANAILDRATDKMTHIPPKPKKEVNYVNQSIVRDWVKIDKTMAFRKEYSDNESLRAWVRMSSNNKKYSYVMSDWIVNCKYKSLQIGKSIYYDKGGNVLFSSTESSPAESIVPETTGEAFYYFSCLQ